MNAQMNAVEFEISRLLAVIAEKEKEAAINRRDAERYSFLRRFDNFATVDAMLNTTEYTTLDSAVDAIILLREQQRIDLLKNGFPDIEAA